MAVGGRSIAGLPPRDPEAFIGWVKERRKKREDEAEKAAAAAEVEARRPKKFWQYAAKPVEVVLDMLQRGEYATANLADALLSGENPVAEVGKGLLGRDKTTWQDVTDKYLWTEKPKSWVGNEARGLLGLALGIALDPITYVNPFAKAGQLVRAGRKSIPAVEKLAQSAAQWSEAIGDTPAAKKLHTMFKTSPRKYGKEWKAVNEPFDRSVRELGSEALVKQLEEIADFQGNLKALGYTPAQVMEVFEKGTPEAVNALPESIGAFITKNRAKMPELLRSENVAEEALGIRRTGALKQKVKGLDVAEGGAIREPVELAKELAKEKVWYSTKGAVKPAAQTYEQAQKAIDDFENVLAKKYGEEELLKIPLAPRTGAFANDPIKTALSNDELGRLRELYAARDAITAKSDDAAIKSVLARTVKGPASEAEVENALREALKSRQYMQVFEGKADISPEEGERIVRGLYSTLSRALAKRGKLPQDLVGDFDEAVAVSRSTAERIVFGVNPGPLLEQIKSITQAMAASGQELRKALPAPAETASKTFLLEFENPLDKAAYIIGRSTRSTADKEFADFVARRTGLGEKEARALAERVRSVIGEATAGAEKSGKVRIPDVLGKEFPGVAAKEIPEVDLSYMMHVPSREGAKKEAIEEVMSLFKPKRVSDKPLKPGTPIKIGGTPDLGELGPFTQARKLEGSVADINKELGYQKFIDNPAQAVAVRELHSIAYTENLKRLKAIKDNFGKALGDIPEAERGKWTQVKLGSLKGAFDKSYFPEEVVPYIEGFVKLAEKPEETSAFLKVFDRAQSWFKGMSYAVWPASHTRNLFDNTLKAYLWGMNNPARFGTALKIQRGEAGKIGKYSFDEIQKLYDEHNVGGGIAKVELGQELEDVLKGGQKFGAGTWNPFSLDFKGMNVGRSVLGAIEGNSRMAFFVDRLAKGDAPEKAAAFSKKVFFDYNDLTEFEQKVMKRIFPFYTFTRKNIPTQFELLLRDPGRWARPFKGLAAMQDEEMPVDFPDWLSESMGVPTGQEMQVNAKGELVPYSKVVPTEYWMSQYGLFDVLPGRGLGKALDMITPFAKQPLEQALNLGFYNRRPIATDKKAEGEPTTSLDRAGQRADAALRALFRPYGEVRRAVKDVKKGGAAAPILGQMGVRTYSVRTTPAPKRKKAEEEDQDERVRKVLMMLGR